MSHLTAPYPLDDDLGDLWPNPDRGDHYLDDALDDLRLNEGRSDGRHSSHRRQRPIRFVRRLTSNRSTSRRLTSDRLRQFSHTHEANLVIDLRDGHGPAAAPSGPTRWRRLRAATIIAAAIGAVVALTVAFSDAVILVSSVAMTVVSITTLAFQLYAWRTPEAAGEDEALEVGVPTLRMIVFLAARKEAPVLSATLERMARLDHPDYAVWVIIDHRDDFDTLAIARHYERAYPGIVKVVPYPDVATSSKPIGLNEAMRLLEASGEHWDVVGVADAEDRFHPDLLATVDYLFVTRNPGIVQGAVQLVNFSVRPEGRHIPEGYLSAALAKTAAVLPGDGEWAEAASHRLARVDRTGPARRRLQHLSSGWWRAANCLEYFKWFSSRLKFQAAIKVMPLGGNTVFFSRDFMHSLRRHTGSYWDEACLTEDCKIGMLSSVLGYGVEVFSVPSMATLEETPATLPKFVRQRVRWMQGFIQVFREGEWLKLATLRQRIMAIYVLGFQFFQAATGVFAPIGLGLALLHKAPEGVVLIAFVPLIISFWSAALDAAMLRDFGQAFHSPQAATKRRARRSKAVTAADYVGIVLGSYPFQVVLAIAAVGAAYRYLAGITNWVKTDHAGAHLDDLALLEPAAA